MLIERTTLTRAAANAARIASSRATLPVLANVKLVAVREVLILEATDLERGLSQTLFTIGDDGTQFATTVDARKFSEVLASMTGEQVELTHDARRERLTVICGAAVVELPGIPASEFPPFAPMPADCIEVGATPWCDAVSRVVSAADGARPVMQGVNCAGNSMSATDGFRIHVIEAHGVGNGIIPAKSMGEAVKLFSKATGIKIASAGGQWFVSDDSTILISQVIGGNFPDWRAILPKERKATIELDVAQLSASLRCVLLMSANNVVRFEVIDGALRVSCQSDETGQAEDVLPVTVSGTPPMFALNGRFTLDALAACRANPVRLHVNAANTPMLFEDGTEWQAVVMPMAVQ